MATVKAFIRTSNKKVPKANVRFRLSDGRDVQLFHKSEIEVDPNLWDAKNECIKAKVIYDKEERDQFDNSVLNRSQLIKDIYRNAPKDVPLSSDWLENAIDQHEHPKEIVDEPTIQTFFDFFDDYLAQYRGTNRLKQHYTAVKRMLQRYELYKQKSNGSFILLLENMTPEILREIEDFLIDEHRLYEKYPDIYKAVPDSRPPKKRGGNRLIKIFVYVRTIVKWAEENKLTTNNPFLKFKIGEYVYGTPYYISIEERNQLYTFDLSEHPELAVQRDIFVFQCLIGCRVGDLIKLTKNSLIDGAIEYIPHKTKEGRPVTVRVPLNKIAREIIDRYSGISGEKLLPFILVQDYNYAIKDIFAMAGLTRLVTVINPLTREEEKRPLNEIASSHLARRTFVGNLYKKVKDPNLVGALSGHKEGSRAFARYRDIDDEMRNDLVKLLE